MPNYVTNILQISAEGEKLKEIISSVRGDGQVYGSFDFNKLKPMPKSLDITDGSITDRSICAFVSHLRDEIVRHPDRPGDLQDIKRYVDAAARVVAGSFGINKLTYMDEAEIASQAEIHNMSVTDFLDLGKQYLDNQLTYGAPTWYKWCTQNWGTKWGAPAGNLLDGENTFRFDTAWSASLPITIALSEKFPDVEFSHLWADEDIGQNVGHVTLLNGEYIDANIPQGGSKEAYEMAFSVLKVAPSDLSLRYSVKEQTYVYDESLDRSSDTCPSDRPPIDNVIDLAKVKALLVADQSTQPSNREDPER